MANGTANTLTLGASVHVARTARVFRRNGWEPMRLDEFITSWFDNFAEPPPWVPGSANPALTFVRRLMTIGLLDLGLDEDSAWLLIPRPILRTVRGPTYPPNVGRA